MKQTIDAGSATREFKATRDVLLLGAEDIKMY